MSIKNYDVVIGLEIHAELNTSSKIFCSCKNEYGAKPNTNICPICTGMPGTLPVVNSKAIQLGIKAGLSLNCEISKMSMFERKNYYYPDLSKSYQITQIVSPIAKNGYIVLRNGKKIEINRIQLEEDAGKLIHLNNEKNSFIDYNRAGAPLIEVVTNPNFSSAEEVVEFLKSLREILVFQDVSKCKMQEGGLRCDVNISLKNKKQKKLGNRTELKNLNSFKNIEKAINYEINRQMDELLKGNEIIQETRKWDDQNNQTVTLREKLDAKDYRYFIDPDIPPIIVSNDNIIKIKNEIVEMPQAKRIRYNQEFGLPDYDCQILTINKFVSDFFEDCVNVYNNPKKISNWIMVNLFNIINVGEVEKFPITANDFTYIIRLVDENKINKNSGVKLLETVIKKNVSVYELLKTLGFGKTVSDEFILKIIKSTIKNKPQIINEYKFQPEKIENYIIGLVMKETNGIANSAKVKDLIKMVL